jgi:hypothetical protein
MGNSEPRAPAPSVPPFWVAQLLGWSAYAAGKYTLSSSAYPSAARVGLLVGIGLLLTLPLRALYRRLRARGLSQPATLVVAALASLLMANVWLLLYDGLLHAVGALPFEGWATYRKGVVNKAPVLLAWSALYLGIKHWQDLQEERERTLRATALATEAQLEMLRYQLQPHFLFNSLNSLRALIAEDPSRAREMVTELAEFLRYSLLSSGVSEVPLADEIASLQRYLALERVRYEERLQVEFAVAPEAASRRVPGFLLHPLAENAVKYGIRTALRAGGLRVPAGGRPLPLPAAEPGREHRRGGRRHHGDHRRRHARPGAPQPQGLGGPPPPQAVRANSPGDDRQSPVRRADRGVVARGLPGPPARAGRAAHPQPALRRAAPGPLLLTLVGSRPPLAAARLRRATPGRTLIAHDCPGDSMPYRRILLIAAAAALAAGTTALAGPGEDERAIRAHIEHHYFDGVRRADTALAHGAFHPVAVMYFVRDGGFAQRSIPDWLGGIAKHAAETPGPDKVERRVLSVDVTGSAAVAKLELKSPQAVLTDYMSLLKVNGEWTIVGKIFDRQPGAAQAAGR